MREIKFRGYNRKNKQWLYGFYLQNRGHHFVCSDEFAPKGNTWEDYEVDPETVGQFTGLTDKNGKEIYEGDVARIDFGDTDPFEVDIRWDDEEVSLALYRDGYVYSRPAGLEMVMEVIGNIHDNPELINE